jgi:hypothetical protein
MKEESAKVSREYTIVLSGDLAARKMERDILVELFSLASKTEEDIRSWNCIADCVDMIEKLPASVSDIVFSRADVLNMKIGFKNSTTNLKANYLIMRNDSWLKSAKNILKQIASFEV